MQRYDLTAEMYEERYCEEQEAKYKKALENTNLKAYGAVLDVGCGTGIFFSHIADNARVVVGVDVSRKLLLKANGTAKAWKNVFVVQADADHLPFKEGFFDVVFSFTVLQNMPQPIETLNELKRVAEAGGSVVVTGLKKVLPLELFMDVLEASGLRLLSFTDDEALKCYIAVLAS